MAFHNWEALENTFESVAHLKETSLPSSVRLNYSISDSTSVVQTEREVAFVAYTKSLENPVTVLQTEDDEADSLTAPPRPR